MNIKNQFYSPYVATATQDTPPLPPIIPSSSPIIDSMESLPTNATPATATKSLFLPPKSKCAELDNSKLLAMAIIISDPQKHQDPTQGTYISYLVTTNVCAT